MLGEVFCTIFCLDENDRIHSELKSKALVTFSSFQAARITSFEKHDSNHFYYKYTWKKNPFESRGILLNLKFFLFKSKRYIIYNEKTLLFPKTNFE